MLYAWMATLLLIAVITWLAHLLKLGGVGFSLGVIVGVAIYNVVHRVRYGYWL